MLGWFGVGLLLLAYVLLILKPKWFIPVDVLASATLTVHAIIINDIPFVVVNAFITAILIIKFAKGNAIN
jgi:hypothetical protein